LTPFDFLPLNGKNIKDVERFSAINKTPNGSVCSSDSKLGDFRDAATFRFMLEQKHRKILSNLKIVVGRIFAASSNEEENQASV